MLKRTSRLSTHGLRIDHEAMIYDDASIFPEAFGRLPTGSIVCMAKRLAKHLSSDPADST
jgi:hypothetical protein